MPIDHVTLRFVVPHGTYRAGDQITYPRGPARSLIAWGVCELVNEPQQPLIEMATVEQRNVETADAPRRRKRR